MVRRSIQVQVFPPYRRKISAVWLRRVAQQALLQQAHPRTNISNSPERKDEGGSRPSYHDLSLVIADDETVQNLNRDYRGLDEPTDVLAFAFDHPGQYEGAGAPPTPQCQEPFIIPSEQSGFAGEVIISYPQCLRQANLEKHPVQQELALLVTHGVLHLLGYDHMTSQEEYEMETRTREVLTALEIPKYTHDSLEGSTEETQETRVVAAPGIPETIQ